MKKSTFLSLSLALSLAFLLFTSRTSPAQVDEPFPFCSDTSQYCQKKVAQVPIPWQFWGVMFDPQTEMPVVIDRIRISPTWLEPPPGLPPGEGPILVRRMVATSPVVLPLQLLNWDFASDMPPLDLNWRRLDPEPVELLPGRDLEIGIPLEGWEAAVLVAYEVLNGNGEVVAHFLNQAVLEMNEPLVTAQLQPIILRIMVNFDVHNTTRYQVTNFELDFHGLDIGCADVVDAIGFVAGHGMPPQPVPFTPWGANPEYPLVVRPIDGGTEVKWVQPDRPLGFCDWLHVGLVFDCTGFDCFNNPENPTLRATVQGYWTILEEPVCEPRTQGFWKRICAGATERKRMHPETPPDFDTRMCRMLMAVDGSDPCARARSQLAALLYNVKYGYLSECCVLSEQYRSMTVAMAVERVEMMLARGLCKEAADLAEAINSGMALSSAPR